MPCYFPLFQGADFVDAKFATNYCIIHGGEVEYEIISLIYFGDLRFEMILYWSFSSVSFLRKGFKGEHRINKFINR